MNIHPDNATDGRPQRSLLTRVVRGSLGLCAATLPIALAVASGPASAAAPPSTPPPAQTFGYTGAVQTYTVPDGVFALDLRAVGGGGGAGVGYLQGDTTPDHVQGGAGGVGGVVTSRIQVNPGEVFDIYVGGKGGDGASSITGGTVGAAGGASGAADVGAHGGDQNAFVALNNSGVGGGGGGGTEITTPAGTVLVVAGGGGGGGGAWSATSTVGGAGGGGGNPSGNGRPGTDKSQSPAAPAGTGGIGGGNSAMAGVAGADATLVDVLLNGNEAGGGGGGGGYLGGTGGSVDAGGGGGGSYADPSMQGVRYSGAAAATDGQVVVTPLFVNNLISATTTNIVAGQIVQLTDTIVPNDPQDPTPTGTVTFSRVDLTTQAQTPIITVPVSAGVGNHATTTIAGSFAGGNNGIIATYNGDAFYPISSSSVFTVFAAKLLPQDSLTASATSVVPGAPVTFTATIAAPASGGPSPVGSVTFNLNTNATLTALATVPLDATGHAVFTTSSLPVGTSLVTGTYSGDANYGIGAPGAVSVNVAVGFARFTGTTSAAAPSVGKAVTVTETVTPPQAGGPTPTGSMTFYDFNPAASTTTQLGTTAVVGGTASFTATNLSVGTHMIFATYSGDGSYFPGTSGYTKVAVDATVYLADDLNNAIRLFGPASSGSAPLGSIAGSATQLANPDGVAVDRNGTLFVANVASNSITEYAAGATGNVAPVASISGPATQLSGPRFIAIDSSGKLYVVDSATNAITVYAAGATGNAAPVAVIAGPATGINNPVGVAVDASGTVWVSNLGTPSITGFARGANGNVAPAFLLAGSSTALNDPKGITFDSKGELIVANATSVNWYRANPTGNQAPARVLSGQATGMTATEQVLIDPSNSAVLTDDLLGGTLSVWTSMPTGNTAPVKTLGGYDFPTQMTLSPGA